MDTFESLKENILANKWSPFYLLMGEEPYFIDRLCDLIVEKALQPFERDFNQTILYGADTSASEIISICCRFPMMAERQLVVIKEAQLLKKIDELNPYLDHIVDTTILVLCFIGKNADKRTTFYKNSVKRGVVFESPKIREEAIPKWIEEYVSTRGKSIVPEASLLLSEYAGNELRKIVLEIDKLISSIDLDKNIITVDDIEKNIGISREFNATELTSALAQKDAVKAFKIAYYFGESPKKYPLQMTLGFLFFFFSKLEQIHAIRLSSPTTPVAKAATDAGIYFKYNAPYIAAAANFNLFKTMKIISLLRECDYKSKSNARGDATDGELLTELISSILIL